MQGAVGEASTIAQKVAISPLDRCFMLSPIILTDRPLEREVYDIDISSSSRVLATPIDSGAIFPTPTVSVSMWRDFLRDFLCESSRTFFAHTSGRSLDEGSGVRQGT